MAHTTGKKILAEWFKDIMVDVLYIFFIRVDIWSLKALCNNTSTEYLLRAYRAVYYKRLKKFGAFIGVSTPFENIPILPHGLFGICISGESKVGRDCVIFQHVTIGSNTLRDSKTRGAPEIGDSVYIGAGARIIGGVKIGNNVRIGANCVVVEDIPDNCVVVSPKPRVIKKDNLDNRHMLMNLQGEWGYLRSGGVFEPCDE